MNRLEKTRAFLTEFIIVVLFFTISAIITLQLFVEANKKSTQSISATESYIMSEDLAENIKAQVCGGGMSAVDKYMTETAGFIRDSEGMYYQYYDKKLTEVQAGDAYILAKVIVTKEELKQGATYSVSVTFENSSGRISSISTVIYAGKEN